MRSRKKGDGHKGHEGSKPQERSQSPVPSHGSMKTDKSMDFPPAFTEVVPTGESSKPQERSQSPVPSHVSMKTDKSMDFPPAFTEIVPTGESSKSQERSQSPVPSHGSMKTDKSMDFPPALTEVVPTGERSPSAKFAGMKHISVKSSKLRKRPQFSVSSYVSLKRDRSMDFSPAVKETIPTGERPDLEQQQNHKCFLRMKNECMVEGNTRQGKSTALSEIYTDLHITEADESGGWVNDEHEVRQIERASWKDTSQQQIKCRDFFKPLPGQDRPVRVVLTKGVAGIGNTVSTQRLILDWAEGRANQDFDYMFPLPFRELNLMKDMKVSLVQLVQHFFPPIKDTGIFTSPNLRILFVFDGLDECRLSLDFMSDPKCEDVFKPTSMGVLVSSLINGDLSPSALVWITTRPAAASQIPVECISRVTEIRGFTDLQKEEYFIKRIRDERLGRRTIDHLKSSRSLWIMCHIPVFCWISATVAERSAASGTGDVPMTLTQMYTHFLLIQTCIKKEKYNDMTEENKEMIFKLAKLACQQLEKGNLIFYEEDLMESGICVTEATIYSGLCTQIFREETGLHQRKFFSFVHVSIQEFLAALYIFLCFCKNESRKALQLLANLKLGQPTLELPALLRAPSLHDIHKDAVDLALSSPNGHLDLFLRFLLGLSLESNQNILRDLISIKSHSFKKSCSLTQSSQLIVNYVKQMIRNEKTSQRVINLFYCLNELNEYAVVEKIDKSSGKLSVISLVPGEWRTIAFVFMMPPQQLKEFELQKFIRTPELDKTQLLSPDEVLIKLVPVIEASKSVWLADCHLTAKCCPALAQALAVPSSSVTRIDLSGNKLGDEGVKLLLSGLHQQNIHLEKLRLNGCGLTDNSCAYLADPLASPSFRLSTLELKGNSLSQSAVEKLLAQANRTQSKFNLMWR